MEKPLPLFNGHPNRFILTNGALSILVKNSENTENSGSGLNEKRFFGSPDSKIPRKSGTAQKVVPFSRLERLDWFLVFSIALNKSEIHAMLKMFVDIQSFGRFLVDRDQYWGLFLHATLVR